MQVMPWDLSTPSHALSLDCCLDSESYGLPSHISFEKRPKESSRLYIINTGMKSYAEIKK
jgi:hypothetical protein